MMEADTEVSHSSVALRGQNLGPCPIVEKLGPCPMETCFQSRACDSCPFELL